jgi:FtsH-binding integral membrane protein
MFMGTYSAAIKGLSVVGLALFSLFVIYDTNTILQRNYYGDFITASLDYYLDIINIFLNLVNFENR